MSKIIKGRVTDGTTYKPLELGAKVVLLDISKEPASVIAGTNTDADGNFTLEVPLVNVPNPLNPTMTMQLPASDTIEARSNETGSHDNRRVKIDFKKEAQEPIYMLPIKTKEEEEVVVTADPDAVACVKKYGVGCWDYETKTCKCSFWTKHKWKIIIGGLILAAITTFIIVKMKKK